MIRNITWTGNGEVLGGKEGIRFLRLRPDAPSVDRRDRQPIMNVCFAQALIC
jgi:hypothetical protein